MRHLLIVATAISATVVVACGGTGEGEKPEEGIKATIQGYYAALNGRDFSGAYGYLSSRCQRAQTPSVYETRSENILKMRPTGDLVLKGLQIETLEGNRAVVNLDVVVVSEGQETSVNWLQWMRTFVREDGDWRIDTC